MPTRRTTTSTFGTTRREAHDASAFYDRFAPPVLSDDEGVSTTRVVDRLFCGDSRDMGALPDASVALVVTSPPYFAGKEYEVALGEGHVPATYLDYLTMLTDVFAECVRVLEPGGRIAVNVANLGRRPYRSLAADVVGILQDRLGLLLRGEVVWVKARGATGSCAWGSFCSPANPVLRDLTERVVLASKGRFDRARSPAQRAAAGLPAEATLTKDEFMEATTDVWHLPAEQARRVSHPAPFPVSLPERLIHLFTYRDDVVLDPFCGSGSTAVAAVRTGRHYLGFDTDAAYLEIAAARIEAALEEAALPVTPRASAVTSAEGLLHSAGLSATRPPGGAYRPADVSLLADTAGGRTIPVAVVGGLTVAPSGFRAPDALLRTLGSAALLATRGLGPLLVLTPELPPAGSPAERALVEAVGRTVLVAVELGDPDAGAAIGRAIEDLDRAAREGREGPEPAVGRGEGSDGAGGPARLGVGEPGGGTDGRTVARQARVGRGPGSASVRSDGGSSGSEVVELPFGPAAGR